MELLNHGKLSPFAERLLPFGRPDNYCMLTDFVYGVDVGMTQSRRRASFTPKSVRGIAGLARSSGKNFNATKAKPGVLGLVTTPIPPPPSFSMMR